MLSPGQITMFSAYPDTYKIHVYDNSGACQIPPEIKAISQTNGTLINDNEGFEVANMGQVPFPNPTEAQHFIWNMRLNSSLVSSVFRVATSTNVQADGSIIIGQQETKHCVPEKSKHSFSICGQKHLRYVYAEKPWTTKISRNYHSSS